MHHIGNLSSRVSTISGSVPVCQEPQKTRPLRSLTTETVESRKIRLQGARSLQSRSVPGPSR